jgi:hypothetical protein
MARHSAVGETREWEDAEVTVTVSTTTRMRSGRVDDQLDVPLEDTELLAEVELTTNLIIAASEADTPLPQDVVDRLLGVDILRLDRPIPTQQARSRD